MSSYIKRKIFPATLLLWGVVLMVVLGSGGNLSCAHGAENNERFVTIDFNDVDINLFIKYISELTGKNFIVDRSVKGNVTIISPTPISRADAYQVFESVLEVHGYTTVPSGAVTKIVPAVEARSKSIATILQDEAVSDEDRVVTQIVSLEYTDADKLKKLLTPLVSKTSVIVSHAQSGVLIITDTRSNIKRLLNIIRVVDVPSIGEECEIFSLQHADVATLAKSFGQLFAAKRSVKGKTSQTVKIIPYERTNSLIVFAPGTQIEKIRDLINRLDTEMPRGEGNIRVYYLQHASAEELVKVLTSLPDKQGSTSSKKDALKTAPALSSDLQIVADVETNSLIITAPKEEYLVLEDVIKKLDIPRRMVYMEALIMEVQVNKDFQLGSEWGGSGSYDDKTGTMFGGFSGTESSPYGVITGLTSDTTVLSSGFTMGVIKSGIEIGGMYFPNLGAVINAYKDDEDINIIATPQILTTDNKEASLKVGENVPYLTSKNTTDAEQDYSNYEYKDVATTLTITPQINQAEVVRLEIGVEVIKLKSDNDDKPTTYTRTVNTTVVVHNEGTVVLGGIIGQDTSSGEYKVPWLGDIPLLGWLFKTRSERATKTNLFIFITPHIIDNPAEIAEMYYKKRDVMEDVRPGAGSIIEQSFNHGKKPEHAAALFDLGFANLQKDRLDKARDFFIQALKIAPDNPYAAVNLGVVYQREGNVAAARKMYQQVIELDIDSEKNTQQQEALEAIKRLARENMNTLR